MLVRHDCQAAEIERKEPSPSKAKALRCSGFVEDNCFLESS
jgi:hypothetical protein